jgi:thiol-disulfide isomerase/thioredoxin
MNKVLIGAIVAALSMARWSEAQDLTMGSKAPKLEVARFVKGEPVTRLEKGKTYVVEFWATWCGPCIRTIPHLTKLQKQYKDITFIGVSIWERDPDAVEEFVEKMGDKMDYRVAVDSVPEGEKGDGGFMAKNWMEPAEQQGIPTAFIINGDGLIAWIGHPGEIDDPLEQIAAGKWDLEGQVQKMKELIASKKKLQAVMVKLRKLFGEFEESGDPKELLQELDIASKELPEQAQQFSLVKFNILAGPKGDVDQALELGERLVETRFSDDAEALNNLAWAVVDPDRDKKADPKLLKFALRVATKADKLKDSEDPSIADTLAKAYFDNGQLDKAVETQERAVKQIEGTDNEQVGAAMKKRLRQYRRAVEASKLDGDKK